MWVQYWPWTQSDVFYSWSWECPLSSQFSKYYSGRRGKSLSAQFTTTGDICFWSDICCICKIWRSVQLVIFLIGHLMTVVYVALAWFWLCAMYDYVILCVHICKVNLFRQYYVFLRLQVAIFCVQYYGNYTGIFVLCFTICSHFCILWSFYVTAH